MNNIPKKTARRDPVFDSARRIFADFWADTPDQHNELNAAYEQQQQLRRQYDQHLPEGQRVRDIAAELHSDAEAPATVEQPQRISELDRAKNDLALIDERNTETFKALQDAQARVDALEQEQVESHYTYDGGEDYTTEAATTDEQPRELTPLERMGGTLPEGWPS